MPKYKLFKFFHIITQSLSLKSNRITNFSFSSRVNCYPWDIFIINYNIHLPLQDILVPQLESIHSVASIAAIIVAFQSREKFIYASIFIKNIEIIMPIISTTIC